jgi:hypothetical protein
MSHLGLYTETINLTEIKVIQLLIKIDELAFISEDLSEQERINFILKKGQEKQKTAVKDKIYLNIVDLQYVYNGRSFIN